MGGFVEANCKNIAAAARFRAFSSMNTTTHLLVHIRERPVLGGGVRQLLLGARELKDLLGPSHDLLFRVFGEAQGQRVVSKWRGDTLTEPSLPAALIRVPRLAHLCLLPAASRWPSAHGLGARRNVVVGGPDITCANGFVDSPLSLPSFLPPFLPPPFFLGILLPNLRQPNESFFQAPSFPPLLLPSTSPPSLLLLLVSSSFRTWGFKEIVLAEGGTYP